MLWLPNLVHALKQAAKLHGHAVVMKILIADTVRTLRISHTPIKDKYRTHTIQEKIWDPFHASRENMTLTAAY